MGNGKSVKGVVAMLKGEAPYDGAAVQKAMGDVIGGSMAKVQENMAKLTSGDREAIAAYLKSIPPIANERPTKK